jgi:hypothetical protein
MGIFQFNQIFIWNFSKIIAPNYLLVPPELDEWFWPYLPWNWGPLHTRDWEPMTMTLQALSLLERRSRSKFASHSAWRTNRVCECMMDVKSTWIPTWHQNGSCFMVTWTTFKNHLLGGRPNT